MKELIHMDVDIAQCGVKHGDRIYLQQQADNLSNRRSLCIRKQPQRRTVVVRGRRKFTDCLLPQRVVGEVSGRKACVLAAAVRWLVHVVLLLVV